MRVAWVAIPVFICMGSASAQWLNQPIPGTPRTKEGKANLSASVPMSSDGHPDLTGLWVSLRSAKQPADARITGPNLTDYLESPNEIAPMLPEAEKIYQERVARNGGGRPSESCLPHSIPDMMLITRPFQIVQTPQRTMILYEFATRFRQVFTDGRSRPGDISYPAWFGYSIAKWEGKTFAVDTAGFNDKSWLDDWGHPHSDALHTIERFTRTDFGHMTGEITIDDPKSYTKPFTITLKFRLMPDTELIEDVCENEKDSAHSGRSKQ